MTEATTTTFIQISVQGSYFKLKKEAVISYNWLLSTMLTSNVPSDMLNDNVIYLDVDPTCFRIILSVLQGLTTIETEVKRISSIEHVLLLKTAQYLLCEPVVQAINDTTTELSAMRQEIDRLETEARKLRLQISFFEKLSSKGISYLTCSHYRTHRPGNKCGAISIILGATCLDESAGIVCSDCESSSRSTYKDFEKVAVSFGDLMYED